MNLDLIEANAERISGRSREQGDAHGLLFKEQRCNTDWFYAWRPLVAHGHLGLGKLYRRTGKRGQAQEHLTTATTMYREMGMTYWLEQAEAEIG